MTVNTGIMEEFAYRQSNVTLESFCVVILVILFLCSFLEIKQKDYAYRWYLVLLAGTLGMLLGDMCDWMYSGLPGVKYHYIMWCGLVLYFASSSFAILSLTFYVLTVLKEKGAKIYRFMSVITVTVVVLYLVMAITTYWHKLFFYIDENNKYIRGPLFPITFVLFALYIVLFVVAFINRHVLSAKERVFILAFISIPVAGTLVQTVFYGIAVTAPASVLATLLAQVFINMEQSIATSEKLYREVRVERDKLQEQNEFVENFIVTQIINVISRTVEAKDKYTQGHSERVAQYTREIVYRMGGSEEEQRQAYYAGLLHDVGKIRVPDTIINKTARLTDEEFEQIRLHTVAGFHILKDVTAIPNLSIGARWHHERYDGSGYPNGLAGENIPYIARVIAVADAYDAMTSNRSYRESLPKSVVRGEIEKGRGTQFDPEIANVMLEMIDEDIDYNMRQRVVFKNISVLIIDDDKIAHKQIHKAFEKEDYVLTDAFDPIEAKAILSKEEFDLCLLDNQMPGMTGLEFMRWINENAPKMKVVMLTGDKELSAIKEGESIGIKDFVTKPVRMATLKESVENVLLH